MTISLVKLLLIFVVVLAPVESQDVDATAYCFQCFKRRNHKDTYADPTGDCYSFYKCLYINATYAVGIKLRCPAGTFFDDGVLDCRPEGPTPCRNPCWDDSLKCFADSNNCASYYVCNYWAAYQFCCPPQTSFNATTCQCDTNPQCTDECIRPEAPPTTEIPPVNFGTYCLDSFKNRLQPTSDPAVFQVVTDFGTSALSCAKGTTFNLDSCRCEGQVVPQTLPHYRQCLMYFPFDADVDDHSHSKFVGELVQPGNIDNSLFATGSGSLRLDGGHLEIPAGKNFDIRNNLTLCFFYRCDSASACSGGLFSDNRDDTMAEFHVIFAALGIETIGVIYNSPVGPFQTNWPVDASTNTPSGFTQFCSTLTNGNLGRLYVNKAVVAEGAYPPYYPHTQCPYTLGYDPKFGNLVGNMDEFLVCPFPLTDDEIAAHYNGQLAAVGLVPA